VSSIIYPPNLKCPVSSQS